MPTAAAAAPAIKHPMTYVDPAQLAESALNSRQRFDVAKQAELEASVKANGVIEALVVRKNPREDKKRPYETVCGERRRRAALAVGVDLIPIVIRTMTDAEVLELVAVENVQRADLHPLEEGTTYRRLHEKPHNYSVEMIAAKVGVSKSHVYQRMQLTTLVASARPAFFDGRLDLLGAIELARIANPKLQEKAAGEVLDARYAMSPMTARDIAAHIRRYYILRLASAPFETNDASLVKLAGPCSACPKQSGNLPDLFSEPAKDALCTDGACWKGKADAAWKKTADGAGARGVSVLTDAQAKKLFPYSGTASLADGSDFVKLDDVCTQDPKQRTYKQLLGKHAPAGAVARVPGTDLVVTLLPKGELSAAMKAAGSPVKEEKKKIAESTAHKADKKAAEDARRKTKLRHAVAAEALRQVVESATEEICTLNEWRAIYHALTKSCYDQIDRVVDRRGLAEKGKQGEALLSKYAMGLTVGDLQALCVELVLSRGAYHFVTGASNRFSDSCKSFGVDVKKVEAKVKAAEREAPEEKKGSRR